MLRFWAGNSGERGLRGLTATAGKPIKQIKTDEKLFLL
jgi:hypothetical protein